MASKNKVDLSDFNYEEDDGHSPMGSLAKQAKSTTRPDAKKGKEISTGTHQSAPSRSGSRGTKPLAPLPNHEVAPKLDQSGTKVASKVAPKLDQSGTNGTPGVTQSSIKVAPEPAPNHAPKLDQSGTKVAPNVSLETLAGLQRNSLIFIYESCRIFGSKISPPIQIKNLAESIKTTVAAARVAVQRIEQKGFVRRYEYKDGRGGWTKYELPDEIYSQLFFKESSIKVASNLDQSSIKVAPEPAPEPAPSSSSSSRDLSLKETTTTQMSVADELGLLDLSQLREFGITVETFKRSVQLHPTVSIEALSDLAFRLSELFRNPKERAKIQNARGFVIKLVEQLAGGITPLDHIETSHERLMREYAILAKQKKAEQQSFEDALLQEAFAKWDQELAEEEKFRVVPLAQNAPAGAPRAAILREYFRENLWPEFKKQMLEREI